MGKGGESTSEEERPSVLSQPRYQPFLQEEFNAADFTSRVLAGSHTTAQAQSEELKNGVRVLEAELHTEVIQNHKALLGHTRRLHDTENSLQDVILSVDTLQAAVKRINAEIVTPYDQIKAKTQQLRNLHATVDLLRHVTHRLKLTQKLKAQMAAQPAQLDLAKAAKLLTDTLAVGREADFTGLEAVEADEEFLKQAGSSIREQAHGALVEGMESLSQAKVGSSLQVFFNLEELDVAVDGLVSKYVTDTEKALKTALDSRQLSMAVGGSRTAAAAASSTGVSLQDKLWSGLKEVTEQMQAAAVSVWHLQRVVAKKRDPLSHVCFLDVLAPPGAPLLTDRFWSSLVRVVAEVCVQVAKPSKGGPVREALIVAYPRLAAMLEAMFERLVQETTVRGVPVAVQPEQLLQLLQATGPFQAAYFSGCLQRMSDAVLAAFPGGQRQLPSPADVQKCIGCIHEELKVGGGSPQLAGMIATVAGKALAVLADKAEMMAASGPEVRALGLAATPAQVRNIALCSQLQEVHRSLAGLLPRLPASATQALAPGMEAVQAAAVEAVAPLFKSAMEGLEERVLAMHKQHFGDGEPGSPMAQPGTPTAVTHTSRYLADLSALAGGFKAEFLSKFVPLPSPAVPSCVGALTERMASRLLLFFVRHAALVRPLSQAGKLQLAKDVAELQLCVGQALWPLEHLGAPYKLLRAFRALLFTEAAEVPGSPLLKDLPASIVLHHMFSRLPGDVKAPHQRSGLSAQQYSLWLDQHSGEEVVRSVRGSLQGPEVAKARQDPAAAAVLDAMAKLCGQ